MEICEKCYAKKPFGGACIICNGGSHFKAREDFKWQIFNYKKLRKSQSKYIKERRKKDPLFKLASILRSRLNVLLKQKGLSKHSRTLEYLGCSLAELRERLEGMFKPGMAWSNHGKWHIDHIIPVCTAKSEEDLYKLFNYKNLQPLWADENLAKRDSIT